MAWKGVRSKSQRLGDFIYIILRLVFDLIVFLGLLCSNMGALRKGVGFLSFRHCRLALRNPF